MIIAACVNEMYTTRSPILPPRLFKVCNVSKMRIRIDRVQQTRTTTLLLLSVFIHAIAFFEASFYLPLFFQVLGSSAIGAGVR
jgi:hypothetical protein